jgi:hypothetical protein
MDLISFLLRIPLPELVGKGIEIFRVLSGLLSAR